MAWVDIATLTLPYALADHQNGNTSFLNNIDVYTLKTGFYHIGRQTTTLPEGVDGIGGNLLHIRFNTDSQFQLLFLYSYNRVYMRRVHQGQWRNWVGMALQSEILTIEEIKEALQ